jgi:hypothetical protein
MPPLPRPPPPDPHPPPSPPPPVNGCQYSCKDRHQDFNASLQDATLAQSFCSDGGPNSVPVAHDPATGAPIFMCDFGTQCDTLECGPRTVEQVEQTICSDICRPTISNGVSFTGASNNGICEDGGDEISHAGYSTYASQDTFVEWRATGYLRIAGCGYGADCTDCGPRSAKARSLEYDPAKPACQTDYAGSGAQYECSAEFPMCIDNADSVKFGSCARQADDGSAVASRRQLQYLISPRPPPDAPYPPPPNPPPLKPPPFPPPSPSPPPAPPGYYRSCGCHWCASAHIAHIAAPTRSAHAPLQPRGPSDEDEEEAHADPERAHAHDLERRFEAFARVQRLLLLRAPVLREVAGRQRVPPHAPLLTTCLLCVSRDVLSFTEDESSSGAYSGWSPIEVRARATQVIDSAVLYGAHATLHRGFATETGQGHVYLTGQDGEIERYVESEAAEASVAHLVSGYRDTERSRNTMLLGEVPLYWTNNTQPSWWPSATDTRWMRLPNNTDPTTHDGLDFWADVCASFCVRRFDDDAEFVELDMTTTHAVDGKGTCACYAYQDTNLQSSHANKTSHAAPDDLRALEFLHRHKKIPDGENNHTHVFAMKKATGHGLWIPELQSTLYHARMFEAGIDVRTEVTLQALDDATRVDNGQGSNWAVLYSISSAERCLSECAKEAVGHRRALKTVRFNAIAQNCYCFESSLFGWAFDAPLANASTGLEASFWERDQADDPSDWFEVKFCEHTRPDEHGRTMVFSKTQTLPQETSWCAGSPAGAGYVLKSGSVLQSYHLGQSSAVSDALPSHSLLSCDTH